MARWAVTGRKERHVDKVRRRQRPTAGLLYHARCRPKPFEHRLEKRMKNSIMNRWNIVALVGLVFALGNALAQDKKAMAKKPFRIIDAVCDFSSSEIAAEKGQFICLYVCRDPDHSKLFQVYSNSSFGKCPTPLKTKIKQTIKEEKPAAPPPAHH